jgi:hypothetical protein
VAALTVAVLTVAALTLAFFMIAVDGGLSATPDQPRS